MVTALFDSHVSSSMRYDDIATIVRTSRVACGDAVAAGDDPARGATLVVRVDRSVHARLRYAVHERSIVRERAPIPVQRWIDVRARARVV